MGRLESSDCRTDIRHVKHDESLDDHSVGIYIPHSHNQAFHMMIQAVSCKIGMDMEHGNEIYCTGK